MMQSGDGVLRRRRSVRSTSCSSCSSKIHGSAQEGFDKLQRASKHFQGKEWKMAVECLPQKTGINLLKRWRRWSEEEDDILIQMVNLHGPKNWTTIARAMPGRGHHQCRDRWTYYLDPSVNKQPWSEQEDITLIRAHKIHGNKWCELSKLFPGRTGKAIKNYWVGRMKQKMKLYLARGLLEEFQNLRDDLSAPNNMGSGTLKGTQDTSRNNQLQSDLLITPKSKQDRLTEPGGNASILEGKGSDSVNVEGYGTHSVDVSQNADGQMDISKFPIATHEKVILSSSSVDQKVSVAVPSFPEVPTNCADTCLSPAHSSQSSNVHLDEICSSADPELLELHQADIADLLDMSYCESLMIIPPDSPHDGNSVHGM